LCRASAHPLYQIPDPLLRPVAGQPSLDVAQTYRSGAFDHDREIACPPRDLRLVKGHSRPPAHCPAQDLLHLVEQHDFVLALPPIDVPVPFAGGQIYKARDLLWSHQLHEHGFALAVGLPVEHLHAASAEQGFLQDPRRGPFALEKAVIVEDPCCFFTEHAYGGLEHEPGLEHI
jgi:hypothetical protein